MPKLGFDNFRHKDDKKFDKYTALRRCCVAARGAFAVGRINSPEKVQESVDAYENFILAHASSDEINSLVSENLMNMPAGARRAYINLEF